MAGLYAIIGSGAEDRLKAVEARLRFSDEHVQRVVNDSASFVWVSHDDPCRFAPAFDPQTGVHLATGGRLAWPPSEVERAKRLPHEGGLHSRLLLERYLSRGADAVAPYNGAAVVLLWDPREGAIHLWTDQFGYHPAFLYHADSPDAVLTTFPDALLADPAVKLTADETSMAEFLRAWRVTPPHTYYHEVKHAGAAAHHTWLRSTVQHVSKTYWSPYQGEWFPSLQEASEELATAISDSVRERTSAAEKPAFFVSGGADSRVMLFAADSPEKVVGVNLYERPTFESATAKKLCERAGARYVGFQRDADYYPRLLQDHAKWSGAMWSAEDGHYLGVNGLLRELGADLVMTACTTDWVFKGYGLERIPRRLFGRDLPFKRFLDRRIDGFLPNYPRPSPPNHAKEIDQRFAEWFAGTPVKLETPHDFAVVEDRRIRPACYTVSVSGQIMYRVLPYDTFLADSRVAACYSRIKPEWKLNGDVWGLAAARVCRAAGDIVDSNYGWKPGASRFSRLATFTRGWIGRRLGPKRQVEPETDDSHPPSNASWPEYGWYARHSKTIRRFWNSANAEERAHMTDLWGSSPWETPLESWEQSPLDFFRILTLLAHWRVTKT